MTNNIEWNRSLTDSLFRSSVAPLLEDNEDAAKLRIRRKLAEYELVKVLPQDLADRLKAATGKKRRIFDKNEREKIALGSEENATTVRLIENATSQQPQESALIKRGPGVAQDGLNGTRSSTALIGRTPQVSQIRPQWHAPWKLKRVISGHQGWVRSVCIDPDNRFFATGSADRTIKIWDLASGTLKLSLTGHIMAIRGLVISPRHPYMFSAGEDKMVKCWDLEQNKVTRQYHGHLSGVYSIDIHPTLDLLVTAGRDAVARVWDIRTREAAFVLSGHKGSVSQVRCQDADPQVITTSTDSTVRLWDLAAGKAQTVLTHHKKSVRALTLHPNEFTFATGSADNIKQWKFPEGAFMHNFGSPQNAIINTLSVNADGVMFAGGDDGSLGFYDWQSGHKFQQMETIAVPGSLSAEAGIFASTFDRSGLRLITCEADKSVKMWEQDRDASPETHPGIEWQPQFARHW
jgi:pleiotropic regulator 1